MNTKKYHIISLGCSKNLVDSHSIAELLDNKGYKHTDRVEDSNYIIVNTCGFIDIAREESIYTIQQLLEQKTQGQKLIITGCLSERYKDSVLPNFPGVDAICGTRRWMDINTVLDKLENGNLPKPIIHFPFSPTIINDGKNIPRVAIQGGSAYVKIADGCRRSCSYCAIPLIKGKSVSRPIDSILKDLKYLDNNNIKEAILIAQDTTDYGYDLKLKDGLNILLKEIIDSQIQIPWLRFLYAYPEFISDNLIELIAQNSNILPYIDLPLQHAHPKILKSMRRPSNIDWVYRTIEKLRKSIPDIAIRTTFIVGYPGETEEEYKFLENFIKEVRFDRVGIFKFSFEKDVPAEPLGDPIDDDKKEQRISNLMEIQESISFEINQHYIGKNLKILVEGVNEDIIVGRSYRDAPEIDGLVIGEGKGSVGDFANVLITDNTTHDLIGRVIS